MGTWIQVEGETRGWLAEPPAGAGPGVLLLHAWWGLNETIRTLADGLAAEGFVVLAPDLYDGVVVDTIKAAEAASGRPWRETLAIVRAAADRLVADRGEIGPGIGVVGVSFGAAYALELAASLAEESRHGELVVAVVLVYGTGGEFDWSASGAAFQGHFAADDPFEPPANIEPLERALRAAGRTVEFHHYPGTGHWFMEPDRADAYNAEAAELAFGRIVEFLHRELGPLGA